jgi:hypothetical protein
MMTGRRCAGGPGRRRLARRLSVAVSSILPGAALVLLPKCPMCLAVWLTAATGIGVSATGVAWGRGMLLVLWMAAAAFAVVLIIRRRELSRRPVASSGCSCHRENLRTVGHGNRAK